MRTIHHNHSITILEYVYTIGKGNSVIEASRSNMGNKSFTDTEITQEM